MTDHSAPTRGEVTQGDIDRADKVGWHSMERRMIIAEEFRAHRLAAFEEAAKVAQGLVSIRQHGTGTATVMASGPEIAQAIRNLGRGV